MAYGNPSRAIHRNLFPPPTFLTVPAEQEAMHPPLTVVAAVPAVPAVLKVAAIAAVLQAQDRRPRLRLLRVRRRGFAPAQCFEGRSEEIGRSGPTCPSPGC